MTLYACPRCGGQDLARLKAERDALAVELSKARLVLRQAHRYVTAWADGTVTGGKGKAVMARAARTAAAIDGFLIHVPLPCIPATEHRDGNC